MDALDAIIAPVRPHIQTLTRSLPMPLQDFATSLLGSECHSSLLLNADFSTANGACVSLAISKTLGVAIVGASAVVKVPQLLKLLNSQSAAGLSFLSYLLETTSFVIALAYNVRNGFPFSTYGETAFIAVQNVAIAVLILVFSGRQPAAAAFIAALSAAGYALFGPVELVDMPTLKYLQFGAGFLGVAAKLPQIWTIYQEGGTGQLSAFAVINYLLGSVARVFTTLKEVDDTLILGGFLAGAFFNAILFLQLVYYWNAPASNAAGVTAPPRKSKAAAAVASSSSSTSSGSSTPAKRATRRRG